VRGRRIPAALGLIAGQSLALGIELAFLVVPGNAVFLTAYGAERLPFVYLVVAALGAFASWGLTALQSRLGLYQLAIGSTLIVAGLTFGTWVLMAHGADWASAGALVLFALQIQLGFVFIGAQVGRAFDLQELKRVFSLIVAAFVVGFMCGGFIAARFVDWGGATVDLIAASAALAGLIALLMAATARHVPEPVHEPVRPQDAAAARPPSLRQILAVPLIGAVFVYQILSAMVTQFVEYLLYDRAAARYPAEEELARFLGQYTALLNLVDLVVLLAFGGLLMARFGLRYGLSVNPVLVTVLIAAAVAVAAFVGPAHLAFFALMAIARITDITTTDAAGRTSINATFKALPARQRLAAQVGVEAAGVPIALGLTALMILGINALPGAGVIHVTAVTLVLCLLWCAMTVVVYRRYQAAVVDTARRRLLDGDAIEADEPATRAALLGLLASDDPRDIGVALSLLGDDTAAEARIRMAADSGSVEVQRAVAARLTALDPPRARALAGRLLQSADPAHVTDGLRILGKLQDADPGAREAEAFLDHADAGVRAAAAGALLRAAGGSAGAGHRLTEAMASPDPEARMDAVRAVAEAGLAPSLDAFERLLADPDIGVRDAATAAVAALHDDQRLALLHRLIGRREVRRVIRACRSSASPAFCATVAALLAADRGPAPDLVGLLSAAGWRAGEADLATIDRLIDRETARIATAQKWREAVTAGDPDLAPGVERLRRALTQEAAAAGRHLTDLLGLVYDRQLMSRVGRVLDGATRGDQGISLESLDLQLAPRHRGRVVRALTAAFAQDPEPPPGRGRPREDLARRLEELVRDCRWAVRADWLLASALALFDDARGPRPRPGGLAALGPVSAELLRAGEAPRPTSPGHR
jgi:hypothetical protein